MSLCVRLWWVCTHLYMYTEYPPFPFFISLPRSTLHSYLPTSYSGSLSYVNYVSRFTLLSSVLLSQKQRKRLVLPTSALDQDQMSMKMPLETKLTTSSINSPQPEQLSFPFFLVSQLPMIWPHGKQKPCFYFSLSSLTRFSTLLMIKQLSHTTKHSHTQTLGSEPGLWETPVFVQFK